MQGRNLYFCEGGKGAMNNERELVPHCFRILNWRFFADSHPKKRAHEWPLLVFFRLKFRLEYVPAPPGSAKIPEASIRY
jgi:hypothetical protein